MENTVSSSQKPDKKNQQPPHDDAGHDKESLETNNFPDDISQVVKQYDKQDDEHSGATTFDLKDAAQQALRKAQGHSEENITHDIQDAAKQALRMVEAQSLRKESVAFNPELGFMLILEENVPAIDVAITGKPLMVGRTDQVLDYEPEIDLTAHGAYRLGISRKHAQFVVEEDALKLVDLGSRNGTQINGQTLEAQQECIINHGDQ
jgi:hypothetical protein